MRLTLIDRMIRYYRTAEPATFTDPWTLWQMAQALASYCALGAVWDILGSIGADANSIPVGVILGWQVDFVLLVAPLVALLAWRWMGYSDWVALLGIGALLAIPIVSVSFLLALLHSSFPWLNIHIYVPG
jgi:hypothetical protein